MKVIALTAFVHGAQNLCAGGEAEFSDSTAQELARSGLVRPAGDVPQQESTAVRSPVTRAVRTPSNKKAAELDNKAAGEGDGTLAEPVIVPAAGVADTAPAATEPGPSPAAAE